MKKGKITARINKKGSIDITIAFKNCRPFAVESANRVFYRLVTSKMKAPFTVEVATGVIAQPSVIVEVVIPIGWHESQRILADRRLRKRMEQTEVQHP